MIEEVWSGGQDGSDIAGLRAAKSVGIPTNGWMPRGWKTMSGPRPEYSELYGLREHADAGYLGRTEANVRDTDATLIIGQDIHSAGSRATVGFCKKHGKPFFHLTIDNLHQPDCFQTVVKGFLLVHKPRKLNAAGNRNAPEADVEAWLVRLLGR